MGQAQSASSMIDQLAVRTANNIGFPSSSTVRAQYLYYLNRSLRYWDCLGSYSFNAVMDTVTIGPGVISLPFSSLTQTIDPGKDVYMIMSAINSGSAPPQPVSTPYAIRRVRMNQYAGRGIYPSQRTNITNIFDHYTIVGKQFLLYPGLTGATSISVVYHRTTAALSDSLSSFTLYPDDFDDVIVDWAEAEIKRVYRIVGWAELLARVTEQGKGLSDQYRTTTDTSGGQQNSLRDMQDKQISSRS